MAKILEKTIKNPLLWQKCFKKRLEVMDAFLESLGEFFLTLAKILHYGKNTAAFNDQR